MTARYLYTKTAYAFYRLFGKNADLLRGFLNAVLPLPANAQIASLAYVSPTQMPRIPGLDRYTVVDAECTDSQGRIFLVALHMMRTHCFAQSTVFGTQEAYVQQTVFDQNFCSERPIYALALLDQNLFGNRPHFYHHFKTVHTGAGTLADDSPQRLLTGLELVLVELSKFDPAEVKLPTQTERPLQALWLRFLNTVSDEVLRSDADMLGNEEIAKAIDLLATHKLSDGQLYAYERSLDHARVEVGMEAELLQRGAIMGLDQLRYDAVQAMVRGNIPVSDIALLLSLSTAEVARFVALK
jgi:predicted transposase/invertase (TIGR01784 family)